MTLDATGHLETAIPLALEDYLELVETNGRVIRENKCGFIAGQTPIRLVQVGIRLMDNGMKVSPTQIFISNSESTPKSPKNRVSKTMLSLII